MEGQHGLFEGGGCMTHAHGALGSFETAAVGVTREIEGPLHPRYSGNSVVARVSRGLSASSRGLFSDLWLKPRDCAASSFSRQAANRSNSNFPLTHEGGWRNSDSLAINQPPSLSLVSRLQPAWMFWELAKWLATLVCNPLRDTRHSARSHPKWSTQST